MGVRDYSSIYNIQDFILNQITPKYFDKSKISLMNTGLYGLTSSAMATAMEDNMRTTSRFITEMIPGQSKLPTFIYANAANYGVTDVFAKCAHCPALLFIKESDILKHGTKNGRYSVYTIDSGLIVYVEDIPFSIPSDIKIRTTTYNGKYNHNCYYDNVMVNDAIDGEVLPYIKSAKTKVSGGNDVYLALSVELYQYTKKVTSETIISNGALNIAYFDVPFEDKLCNFEVFYTNPNTNVKTQLVKKMSMQAPTTKPFIYYELLDESTLRLSFGTDDRYFVPVFNASLEIYMFETVGTVGEMPRYKGDDIFVTANVLNEDYDYNKMVSMYCTITGDSIGAKDSYSLEDINMIVNERQVTVDSITTDHDLDVYFETNYSSIYGTSAKAIRTRDDVAGRIYSVFTRLKDENDVYPTNTVNIEIRLNDETHMKKTDDKIMIKSGIRIGYDNADSINNCVVLSDDVEEQDMEYTTLGLMSVDKNPTSIAFYMNSVDKTVNMDYNYVNDESLYQFIVKSFNISRNAAVGDDSYKISVVIIPTDLSIVEDAIESDDYSGGELEDDTEEDTTSFDLSKIKLYLFATTNSGHYIELKFNRDISSQDTGYLYECELETDDLMSGSNIKISGLTSCATQTESDCFMKMSNPDISLLIFYKETISLEHSYTELIPAMAPYTLCNTFTPRDEEIYFAYPMNLIQPVVEFFPDDTEEGFKLMVSGVPVVKRDFIINGTNLNKLLERVNTQHEFLNDSKITSNFSICMKFYNTYGRSRIFTITNGQKLNHVNMTIELTIAFMDGIEPSEYINNIKLTIKDYIEGINNVNDSGVNSIKISNLIKLISNTYANEVDYIIFNSINGYDSDIQTITMEYDLSDADNIKSIPEFLTLSLDDIHINVK